MAFEFVSKPPPPQFKVQVFEGGNGDKLWFYSPSDKTQATSGEGNSRASLFQANHTTPSNVYQGPQTTPEAREFYDRISSTDAGQYKYDHTNFDKNGQYVPQKGSDALRVGVASHNGSHHEYDAFVRARDAEIIVRGQEVEALEKERLLDAGETDAKATSDARKAATEFMAREKQGLQKFLNMAVQEGGIPETEVEKNKTLLAFNDFDPRNVDKIQGWAADNNADAINNWDMDRIAGELDAQSPGSYKTGNGASPGTEAFRSGVDGTDLPNDRLAVVTEGDDAGKQRWMVDDTPEARAIRAEVIVRDALVRANGDDFAKIQERIKSGEFDTLKTSVLSSLNDSRFFPDADQLPLTFEEYSRTYEINARKTNSFRAAFSSFVAELNQVKALDASVFDAADRNTNGLLSKTLDFLNNDFGSVSAKGALSIVALAFGALAVHYKYKADTLDDPGKLFTDWAIEASPEFFAKLPFGVSIVAGAVLLAKVHPVGRTAVFAFGAAVAYPEIKEFFKNYKEVHKNDPDNDLVTFFEGTVKFLDALESNPAVAGVANLLKALASRTIVPLIEATTVAVVNVDGDNAMSVDIARGNGDSDPWLVGDDGAELVGNKNNNVLFHFGYGEARGGEGDDWLISFRSEYLAPGEKIGPSPKEGDEDFREVSEAGERLVLDGEEGDDILIALGGTGAILVGGEGRDFLFNTSFKGQMYGDTIDGVGQSASGTEDSDVFWYWPSTFIMDAQPNDILQMFGWPLLGGSNSVAGRYAGDGSLAIDWLNWTVFYGATKSGQLLVVNAVAAALGIGARDGDPFPAGTMVVEDYDFGGWKDAEWGRPAAGDLGLTFRMATNRSDSVEISILKFIWGHLTTVFDVFFNLTKLVRWQPVDDPLVLDLDGDGIETVSQSQSGVHFDMDGDYFAEASGWVSSDDGFLVID
ncbi:MAG: hypothetical protein GY742_19875, partial [Hyphomicrobiales bacterium]|nr:hypothetical protein [Hyphomicrobiales bacterium]